MNRFLTPSLVLKVIIAHLDNLLGHFFLLLEDFILEILHSSI